LDGVGFGGKYGYRQDPTGLYLLGSRYYDPTNARFLTRDPTGYQAGPNLYAYCEGNPITRCDPEGTDTIQKFQDQSQMALGKLDGVSAAPAIHRQHVAFDAERDRTVNGCMFAAQFVPVFGEAEKGIAAIGTAVKASELAASALLGLCAKKEAGACAQTGLEFVGRWMSKAELESTGATGLVRGGRIGRNYVTDVGYFSRFDARLAREQLALPQTPEVYAILEVPKGAFPEATIAEPRYSMPGGGPERWTVGNIPARVIGHVACH
jgi:RHS repeat-associated protein